jgi:formylglycine-generating enzyme required for sulfatase activity
MESSGSNSLSLQKSWWRRPVGKSHLLFSLLPLCLVTFTAYYFISHHHKPRPHVVPKKIGTNFGVQPGGTQFLLPEMVAIPAGSYRMGGDNGENDELPSHKVTLDSFELGRFEVTNAQWKSYCDANGVAYPPDAKIGPDYFNDFPNFPVVNVSWEEAQQYCKWLSKVTGQTFRLPSEAEWEYAAQDSPMGRQSGNRSDDYPATAQVGCYEPNDFGLYDMLGNVWEWCEDWYSFNYYSESKQDNPAGPATGNRRVLRGGSWGDPAMMCRPGNRIFFFPAARYRFYGLRVAATVKPENTAVKQP